MSDNIQFQDDQDLLTQQLQQRVADKTPWMAKKLITWGIAKDATQAYTYLLGLVVVIVTITVFISLSALRGPVPVEIDPNMIPGADGQMNF